eukprot:TRINITY_DN224_c4_g1_i1.p1 TRINITY_DN224_c4_g1~~TRINITY_DN224_c4_g1_i1.p1  ORF type:complete len:446 (+),score=122.82 TRINITY_DN224_c4_g1_i1:55-1392(+)
MSAKAFDAAFSGDLAKVKSSTKSNKLDSHHKERGTTLLYTAARFGHLPVVKYLIETGANINLKNEEEGSESTPLHGAAYGGHYKVVEYLLGEGAALKKNCYGDYPSVDASNPHDDVSSSAKKKCIALFEEAEEEQDVGKKSKKSKTSKKSKKEETPEEEEEEEEEDPKPKKTKKTKKEEEPEESPPKKKKKVEKKVEKDEDDDDDEEDEVAKLKKATFTLAPIEKDCEEFWEIEEKLNAHLQGRNDDYNKSRVKAGKKPLTFILIGAEKVKNKVLEDRFNKMRKTMKDKYPKEKERWRERVSFHGSNPKNIPSILRTSLLRFKHPLNPCKNSTDDGWFGTNKKGVYVSKYADYTFKYSNDCTALDNDQKAKTIMFKTLPGKSKHIPAVKTGLQPAKGFDSHSSPNYLEWYLFEEGQLCPEYVLEVQAREDNRTAADDGDDDNESD